MFHASVILLAACGTVSYDDNTTCPNGAPYTPTGAAADTAGDCQADSGANLCPYYCLSPATCDGTIGATSCEPCGGVVSFANSYCPQCELYFIDGFMAFDCAPGRATTW